MSRLLFYSVPLAAAGISSWRWYLQLPRPPEPTGTIAEPVFIPSRFPPQEAAADTAIYRRPSVLELHGRPLARLRVGDAFQRREAAAALAQLSELNDADCQQLAQTLDYQAALLLANWSSTDLRLFLPPPGAGGATIASSAPLELRLRLLLESLPPGPPCAEFWRARALRHPPAADWEPTPLSADPADVGAPPPWRATPTVAVEADCLRALLERADSPPQVSAMLEGGVLNLLATAHAQRPRDANRCGLIAKILGGFRSAGQLFQAGWLGVLAAWSREGDVRVGPAAWRVIRNLTLAEGLLETPALRPAERSETVTGGDEVKAGNVDESKVKADANAAAEVNVNDSAKINASAHEADDVIASMLVILDGHWAALRSRVLSTLSSLGLSEKRPLTPPTPRALRPLPDGVLVLHPRSLAAEAATEVDIVLVHGLLGGTERTWRQSDETRATLPPPAEPRLSEIVLRRRRDVVSEGAGGTGVDGVGIEEARGGVETGQSRVECVPRDGDAGRGGGDVPVTGDATADTASTISAGTSAVDVSHSKDNTNATTNTNANYNSVKNNNSSNDSKSNQSITYNTGSNGSNSTNKPSTSATSSSSTSATTVEPYTQCWPRDWLPPDLLPLRVRILSVDYDSAWSDWRPRCAARRSRSLADRAAEMRRVLTEAGVGDRPVVWVAHSMGGLLVKQMLVDADREALRLDGSDSDGGARSGDGGGDNQRHVGERRVGADGETRTSGDKRSRAKVIGAGVSGANGGSGDAQASSNKGDGDTNHVDDGFTNLGAGNSRHLNDRVTTNLSGTDNPSPGTNSSSPLSPLLSSTLGVLFLSCPHSGSGLASSVSGALRPLFLPSAELDALRRHSPPLLRLRDDFVSLCLRRGVRCLCVAETRPQPLLGRRVMFVEEDSADAGVGPVVKVDENHLGVCKPKGRESEVYRLVVQFVKEVCEGV